MNRDFHYFGTYGAARLAGFNKTESTVIAHAAQYVDDSTHDRLINGAEYNLDFQPIPTTHTMVKDLVLNRPSEVELRRVWVPFHFLPGNLTDPPKAEYNGPTFASRVMGTFDYDEKAKREFQLMCLPESELARDMINDIITNHMKRNPLPQYLLHIIGIRMHVLADTLAHYNFSGTVSWHVNDVVGDVVDLNKNEPIKYSFFKKDGELFGPDLKLDFNTISFLGHGRLGSILDYPWLKFEYTPRWLEQSRHGKTVKHDNPAAYLQSFRQMYTAMSCIKTGKKFDFARIEPLNSQYETIISRILNTQYKSSRLKFFNRHKESDRKQPGLWYTAFNQDQIMGNDSDIPELYDKDAWVREVTQKQIPAPLTDYFQFNKAAIIHRDFVESYLRKKGIDLTVPDLSCRDETSSII